MPHFKEFNSSSLSDWQNQVSKELKGLSSESLNFQTSLGFEMPAFVTEENARFLPKSTESKWPYTHGYYAEAKPWVISERIFIDASNIDSCNKQALLALEQGATGLHICGDPDNEDSFKRFMSGILPEYISIWFSGTQQYRMARWLSHLAQERGINPSHLHGGLLGDGSLAIANQDLPHFAQIVAALPNFRCLWTDASSFYEQGLSVVDEAAFALLSGKRLLQHYTKAGISPDEIGKYIQFRFSSPLQYFIGIARQRAFRYCWSQVMSSFNPEHNCSSVASIYTQTAYRHLSKRDVFNNLLRNTTASMAMVIGGTDALEVLPHDSALGMGDSNIFSNRMARNIQLILAHECGFDQLVDPAGGSFYLETMTFHLAEAILLRLEAIENEMNWEDWVKKGIIEHALSEQQKIKEEVNNGTLPIIGVNLYPNNQELINDPMLLDVLKKVESKFREAGDMERQTVSH